jgi:hypothetical protein
MSIAPTNAPSVVVARPRGWSFAAASWSKKLMACTASMTIEHGDTTGTTNGTESERLTPGHLMGVLT